MTHRYISCNTPTLIPKLATAGYDAERFERLTVQARQLFPGVPFYRTFQGMPFSNVHRQGERRVQICIYQDSREALGKASSNVGPENRHDERGGELNNGS